MDIQNCRWHHESGHHELVQLKHAAVCKPPATARMVINAVYASADETLGSMLCLSHGHLLLLPMRPSPHSAPVHLQGSHPCRAVSPWGAAWGRAPQHVRIDPESRCDISVFFRPLPVRGIDHSST